MIPDFRYFIERVRALQPSRKLIDRCNLTILLESGHEDLAQFLAAKKVEIIASMPCYTAENVNAQRGEGVFDGSIKALQLLNSLGYGVDVDPEQVDNREIMTGDHCFGCTAGAGSSCSGALV